MNNTAFRQRGYNLVEMFIALIVLGLLLGGALVPLQVRFQEAQIDSVNTYIKTAKEAIFAYALQNQTEAREVDYYDGLTYDLPGGRPYLPCPDITNDGIEDRVLIPVTLTVVKTDPIPADNEIVKYGHCEEQKGLLPWKTLGIKDIDPWGNRLTYRVDMAFSNQFMGFDEDTYADIFDRRLQLSTDNQRLTLRQDKNDAGSVVCDAYDISDGGCPNNDLTNILAGVVTSVSIALNARRVPNYDPANAAATGIVNGAVFVIVSHGANGWGAIHADNACRNAALETGVSNPVETVNAYYAAGHQIPATIPRCSALASSVTGLNEYQFISVPINKQSNADLNQPDDIVEWVGTNELLGAMLRGGVLPVRKLEFLPE